MKILPYLIASALFANLQADNAQTESTQPKSTKNACPYFLDCREIMGKAYGELLFLQPNGSSLYYAAEAIPLNQSISNNPVLQAVSPNWKIFELSPGYNPAFKFGGKIIFSPTHTNLEVSWERLYTSTSSSKALSTTADGGTLMIGPLFDIGPNSSAYTNAKGKAHFQYDSVNFVFGQKFCALQRWFPNFFAGVEFARIKQSLKSTFSNVSVNRTRSVDTYSTFLGAGPKIGANFDFRVVSNFFFTGTLSCGLLIGQLQNGTTFKSTAPFLAVNGLPQPNTQKTTVPNRTQLIPSFEERLGFAYTKTCKCWKAKVEVGYLAQIYLNAIQTIDMTAPQVPPSILPASVPEAGVYAVGFERTLSNFILTGPYVALAFDF